jgi:hypothetical protein
MSLLMNSDIQPSQAAMHSMLENTGKIEQGGKALHGNYTPIIDDTFLILQMVNTDNKNVTC